MVEVSFKEGIKDRENTLTVKPENAFLVSDSLDAFSGSLVIGTPVPTYEKESSSQVSAAATIDGVQQRDYDLFLSWPVNGGAASCGWLATTSVNDQSACTEASVRDPSCDSVGPKRAVSTRRARDRTTLSQLKVRPRSALDLVSVRRYRLGIKFS